MIVPRDNQGETRIASFENIPEQRSFASLVMLPWLLGGIAVRTFFGSIRAASILPPRSAQYPLPSGAAAVKDGRLLWRAPEGLVLDRREHGGSLLAVGAEPARYMARSGSFSYNPASMCERPKTRLCAISPRQIFKRRCSVRKSWSV